MATRTLLALVTSLCCTGSILSALPVQAEVPLTRATVQRLRERVLLRSNQQVRDAVKADVMTPGDALQTFRKAMAELRFNDRSLARIGEQAIFHFEPNTRNIDLRSGTVLLLIQPGQGRTRVRTPNASAGIRGSALFVRYVKDTNVTMVGALTNSEIEITNSQGKTVILKAGQLGYVYQDQIGVYNFDQKLFQETSPFFKDIDWNDAPEAVREEINVALQAQTAIAGNYQDSPDWTKLSDNRTITEPIVTYANRQAPGGDRISKDWIPEESRTVTPTNFTTIPTQPVFPAEPIQTPAPPVAPTAEPPVATVPQPPSRAQPAPLPVRPTPVVVDPAPGTQAPSANAPTTNLPGWGQVPATNPAPPPVASPPVLSTPPVANPPAVTPPAIAAPPIAAPAPPVVTSPPPATTPPITPPVVTPPIATPPVGSIPSQVSPPTRPIPAPLPTPALPATPAVPAVPTISPAIPATPAVPPSPIAPATPIVTPVAAPAQPITPPPGPVVAPPVAATPPTVAPPAIAPTPAPAPIPVAAPLDPSPVAIPPSPAPATPAPTPEPVNAAPTLTPAGATTP